MTTNNHYVNTKNIHRSANKNIDSHPKPQKYTQQDINFSDTPLFFPAGLERIFLFIYVVTLPYIAGLTFLFFYIANGNYKIFLSLSDTNSYILTWAIGYEILAAIILLVIMKNTISFSLKSSNRSTQKKFIIP